jgi:hypothetical protein
MGSPFEVVVFTGVKWCALIDVIRTDFRKDVENLFSLIPPEMKERLLLDIKWHTAKA